MNEELFTKELEVGQVTWSVKPETYTSSSAGIRESSSYTLKKNAEDSDHLKRYYFISPSHYSINNQIKPLPLIFLDLVFRCQALYTTI